MNKTALSHCSALIIAATCIIFPMKSTAQDNRPVQTIRGIVVDHASGVPLPFASVGLPGMPQMGSATGEDGTFVIRDVPVGRHDLQASSVGYEPALIREVLVTSAREVYLEIQLRETVLQLDEVVVSPRINKEEPLNSMALSGARMLSVEEATRFAGGMDDPARLVSSFAGVASGVATNGISIHGNSPALLQWRLEDVEIPNPNHFADVASLGGGLLSSLSSHVLGNSDFYSSAFPAEYHNAVSGVFDMKLRNGNSQHTLQAGILGLDVASEGPLSRNHNASYLFNYRYSTTGLMNDISPAEEMEQLLAYQDLNFKFHFPTKKAGTFSLWGTGLTDDVKPEIESPESWTYRDDAKDSRMKQTFAASGLSHRYFFSNNGLLKITLAATYSKTDAWEDLFDADMNSSPWLDFSSRYTNFVLTSSFNRKYSSRHSNKTGITLTNMNYHMEFDLAPYAGIPVERIAEGKGSTQLIAAYTSSLFHFNDRLSATLGLNAQFMTLNNSRTIEPRTSVRWQAPPKHSFSLAYGLHSRMEKMDVYFVKTPTTGDEWVNLDLDFTKTHHFSFSYTHNIANDMVMKIEPWYQFLFDVPVIANSSWSVLNRDLFYVENALVNEGKGRNFGVDVTFEKYMTSGFYYMATASLFDSKYRGGDGVWYDTRFNRNYIINGLIGKEWMVGRNNRNVLGVNLKLTLQGGDRYSPVDEQATLDHPDQTTQYDETQVYSNQLAPIFLANYTISYRMNRNRVSHEFAIKALNATGYQEYFRHEYNLKTGVIEPRRIKNALLNLVYRIDF